jgi:hypothetical protein
LFGIVSDTSRETVTFAYLPKALFPLHSDLLVREFLNLSCPEHWVESDRLASTVT